jgi:hypothetical protein
MQTNEHNAQSYDFQLLELGECAARRQAVLLVNLSSLSFAPNVLWKGEFFGGDGTLERR